MLTVTDEILENLTSSSIADDTKRIILNKLLNEARNEGWHSRDNEVGTRWEVGYWTDDDDDDDDDESEGEEYAQKWVNQREASSEFEASSIANRWGCDYRIIRSNPFENITKHQKTP